MRIRLLILEHLYFFLEDMRNNVELLQISNNYCGTVSWFTNLIICGLQIVGGGFIMQTTIINASKFSLMRRP
jgi:hypothetical protein